MEPQRLGPKQLLAAAREYRNFRKYTTVYKTLADHLLRDVQTQMVSYRRLRTEINAMEERLSGNNEVVV